MKVLTTSASAQVIKVIPRSYPATVTLKLRDDSTNDVTTATVSTTTDRDYLSVSHAFSLKEGRFYDLTLLDGLEVIYLDKIFCTDQTIDQDTNDYYSINKNEYISEPSNNDYIIL
jgi:hypothetical protein